MWKGGGQLSLFVCRNVYLWVVTRQTDKTGQYKELMLANATD